MNPKLSTKHITTTTMYGNGGCGFGLGFGYDDNDSKMRRGLSAGKIASMTS